MKRLANFNASNRTPAITSPKIEEMRRFESGAVRGSGGKFDFPEYLSAYLVFRFAEHMKKNAVKYGAGNWKKRNPDGTTGIPRDEYWRSFCRHFFMLYMYETEGVLMEPETDHISAMIFNLQGLVVHDEEARLKDKHEMYGYAVESSNQANKPTNNKTIPQNTDLDFLG